MKKIIAICFFLIVCSAAICADAPAPVPTVPVVTAPQDNFLTFNLDSLVKVVFSIFVMGLSWISYAIHRKNNGNTVLSDALEALEAGVAHSEEAFVEWAKAAKADKTLSKEERQQAMQIARDKAMELAKGPALDLLKSKGTEILNSWIKKILDRKAAASK